RDIQPVSPFFRKACEKCGLSLPVFVPYIQLYEFEALLPADPQKLNRLARLWPRRSVSSLFGTSVPISTSGSGRSKNLDKTQVSDLAL
ncbi:MAG TPA: hypothetical protein PKJ23_16090, partial [bacterium]|nr:hypothetical protein [bacterium]